MKTGVSFFQTAVFVACAAVSQSGMAAALSGGSVITLTDSYGTTGGGEFIANHVSGPGSGPSFITFCLEKDETFTPGSNLYVKSVSTEARDGGSGGPSPDPIIAQTAYLYSQFRAGTLSNYDYASTGSAHVNDANSLQKAIWYFEQEITSTSDAQANLWITEANNAVAVGGSWYTMHGTGIGNVRVLNLYKNAAYTIHAQDQLYLLPVPEPEVYAMLAAGLGLLGFVARRRKLQEIV